MRRLLREFTAHDDHGAVVTLRSYQNYAVTTSLAGGEPIGIPTYAETETATGVGVQPVRRGTFVIPGTTTVLHADAPDAWAWA